MNSENNTLFGGKLFAVVFADQRTEEIKVRQLPIGQYEKAFAVLNDEMALTALICDRPKDWITGKNPDGSDSMNPESYEELFKLAGEVNAKGFFAWSGRKAEKARLQMLENAKLMAMLPEDMVNLAINMSGKESTSPTSSPRPVLPRH